MTGMSSQNLSITSWGWWDDTLPDEGEPSRYRVWKCREREGKPVMLMLPESCDVEDAFMAFAEIVEAEINLTG